MTDDRDPEDNQHITVDAAAAEVAQHLTANAEVPAPTAAGPQRTFFVRKRTFFSLLFPLVLLVLARPLYWWYLGGVAAVIAGQALRLWAAGTINKDDELTLSGPYARVRNPLYVGSFLMALGYCLMSGRWWSFPALLVLFPLFYCTTIIAEEHWLASKFGQAFDEYYHSVPRFRPRLAPWGKAEGGFALMQAQANHEHVSLIVSGILTLAFALRTLLPML